VHTTGAWFRQICKFSLLNWDTRITQLNNWHWVNYSPRLEPRNLGVNTATLLESCDWCLNMRNRKFLPSQFVFLWPPPHWQSCYCNFIPSCSIVPELPCFLLDCHPCKHHVVWRLRQPVAIFPLPMLSEQCIYCTSRWLTNSPHLMSRAHQQLVVRLLPTLLCVCQQLSLYRCYSRERKECMCLFLAITQFRARFSLQFTYGSLM